MRPEDTLAPMEFGPVEADKMKILAALLRDPNPIHWDRDEVARRGLGDRLINQGPTNLGYVANMLAANAGGFDRVRRLTVRFGENVREGDRVIACGVVKDVAAGRATVEVWLELDDGRRAVEGTAEIVVDG